MGLFTIGPDDIERLDERAFVEVLNHLPKAESYRLGIPLTGVDTSPRIHDPDGGVDARVHAPENVPAGWIPSGESVWQFKAGKTGASDLEKELNKSGVQDAVLHGTTYCFVVGHDYGDKERKAREEWLQRWFGKLGLERKSKFLTASHVANWASERPSVALLPCFHRPVGGLCRFEAWSNRKAFSEDFVADELRTDIIQQLRAALHKPASKVTNIHFRIEGLHGVGKTRLALEALREEGMLENVLYAGHPSPRLNSY